MSVERVSLVRVPSPDSEADLVTIVDTLEAFGIPCFVDNPGGGSRLARGPVRRAPVVMVPQERLAAALELIRVHRRARAAHGEAARLPWSGRLRALLRLMARSWSAIAPRQSSSQREPVPVPAEKRATAATESCRSHSNRWSGGDSR